MTHYYRLRLAESKTYNWGLRETLGIAARRNGLEGKLCPTGEEGTRDNGSGKMSFGAEYESALPVLDRLIPLGSLGAGFVDHLVPDAFALEDDFDDLAGRAFSADRFGYVVCRAFYFDGGVAYGDRKAYAAHYG